MDFSGFLFKVYVYFSKLKDFEYEIFTSLHKIVKAIFISVTNISCLPFDSLRLEMSK